MKDILNQLFEHQHLDRAQATEILINIAQGGYAPAQVAAFVTVYLMRSVTVEELAGFRDALLQLCTPVELDGRTSIDLCGTGGDGKNTFNISTCASFVVAGAGIPVTKHGNYGVSSICGSSNVMDHLGYRFPTSQEEVLRQLDKFNFVFLHAPLFHPALKAVSGIRKELGVKTFFNMLGPLVNPAQPPCQLVGVFNLRLARLYQHIFEETDRSYRIVHSLDGYDEVSLTAPCKVISQSG
ncbi:MAG: anthranilate phosphoribosyltransferase, partial [Saprospiraceae bacterium]|nr:anthranilate phosphoribosyltransferase [Saprospiraceae bacterium]